MRARAFHVIPECHKELAELKKIQNLKEAWSYLLKCDIKTINTVILITEIGRRYQRLKIKRPILHVEKVLLEWSDFVCISAYEPKEYAIQYVLSKRDFFAAYLYGLDKLTYNIA